MHRYIVVGRYVLALALAACSTYGPTAATHGGAAERDSAAAQRSNSGSTPAATGGTLGSGAGSVAGQSAPSGPGEKEQQRGNTPPGVDRDGHGPAAGAILDPAGVTTKGR